jgi:monothiol glutaredoxin
MDLRIAADLRVFAYLPFETFDQGRAALEALPRDTPIAFLCHAGGRSGRAAEEFRQLGFRNVHNVAGGITAWADTVDGSIPRY